MSSHAKLSPSSAHRWIHCTASADVEYKLPEVESPYAKEGTLAHKLCEQKLNFFLEGKKYHVSPEVDADMEAFTNEYRDYVIALHNEAFMKDDNLEVYVEKKLKLTDWIPRGFGTADCIIAYNDQLHVIDFKYGKGVQVFAEENEQLKCYGLGALDLIKTKEINDVYLHIIQPRLDHIDVAHYSSKELLEWGESILKPKAVEAFGNDGIFLAGEWCRFCKASSDCKARNEQLTKDLEEAKESMNDRVYILEHMDEWMGWLKEVQASSLEKALNGEIIPGFKAVNGRGKRIITDSEKVAAVLKEAGYYPYKDPELLPLTKLEKLTGKKTFSELCQDYIDRVEGKPALVREDDPRPAIGSIDADFEIEGEN